MKTAARDSSGSPLRWLVVPLSFAASGCLSASAQQARQQAALERPASAAVTNGGASAPSNSCGQLARAAARGHPRIEAARARARSALAIARSESSLPAPRLSAEVWDFPLGEPAAAAREGMYMFGVSQEFQPFGVRQARVRSESEATLAEEAEAQNTERRVVEQFARSCLDWSSARAVRDALQGQRLLLADLREAMLARVRTGGESQGMLRRTDAELAAAERRLLEAEEELQTTGESLRAMLGEAFALPESPPALEAANPPGDPNALLRTAMGARADLIAARARSRAAHARRDAARAESLFPTFDARVTWMQTPGMRPGLGAMVSMTLPWLWGGAPQREEGAAEEWNALLAEEAASARDVRIEVTRAFGQYRAMHRALRLLREREIPAAEAALVAEQSALAGGGLNLVSWLQAAQTLREARVDEARMISSLSRAQLELELSVGRPLNRPETESRGE